MIATLYDSIVICPGAPKALLECLLFHKTLIRYEDYPPAEQRITTSYSEEVRSLFPCIYLHACLTLPFAAMRLYSASWRSSLIMQRLPSLLRGLAQHELA